MTFHAREIQLVQGAAAALVPLLDQGPRRAASPRRAAAGARVHHEGRVLVRSRRGRRATRASSGTAALRADLRPLWLEAYRRPGGEPGSWVGSSASASSRRPARARTSSCRCENGDYCGRYRDCAGESRDRRPLPRPAGRAGGGGDARRGDDRGAREFLGDRCAATSKAMPVVVGDGTSCSRSFAATTGSREKL